MKWWIISFNLTDEQDFTTRRIAVVEADTAPAASSAFVRALGGGGTQLAAVDSIWGDIPEYFDGGVESADGAFYITGTPYGEEGEDYEPETEVILLTPAQPEEESYPSEQAAIDAIEEQLPGFGGTIVSIDYDENVAVIE